MNPLTKLFFTSLIIGSCSTNTLPPEEPSYIKVMIAGDALNPNAYNKGIGTEYYCYYNPVSDSIIYLYPKWKENDDQSIYVNKAFCGRLDNQKAKDTLMQLFNSLDWRAAGSLDSILNGNIYCGWEYCVEFKTGKKIKYYNVTAGVSDTLDRFFHFFVNLEHARWKKVSVTPSIANVDKEVVAYLKGLGTYEKLDIPYIFPKCDSGINFKKLAGRWRTVGNTLRNTSKEHFYIYTLNKERTFVIQKYTQGKFTHIGKGTYSVDTKAGKIFYVNTEGYKMTQTLEQLTDSCLSGFQATEQSAKSKIKFNRY